MRYNGAAMNRTTPLPVIPLIIFAIAFGIEEAIIVVYLRHLPSSYMANAYALEMFRELATLVIIAAVAWIATSSWGLRARAFCFAFGAWDIVYYIALWKLIGFPSLTDDDVLFLVPVPWIAPVWAPVAFAALLMVIGLFGVASQRSVLLASGFTLALLSFMYRSALHVEGYPLWLFAVAFILALAALPAARIAVERPESLRRRGL